VGSRHVACVTDEDGNPMLLPGFSSVQQINHQDGGGYTSVNDPDPTLTDPQVFDSDIQGPDIEGPATCFSWISTQAGDQEITIEYVDTQGTSHQVSWDTDNSREPNSNNNALIKEWNVLEGSCISVDHVPTGAEPSANGTTAVNCPQNIDIT